MNQMMVSVVYADGAWFTVDGEGYRKTGAIRSVAGVPMPDFTNLALGMVLDSDATVGRRRHRGRRPDRGCARGARGEARRRRGGDPARVPAARRGAVRLRLQVHGDVPPRRSSADASTCIAARQGRSRRRARTVRTLGRPAARRHVPIADAARRHRRRERADGGEGPARAGVRGAASIDDGELDTMASDPDVAHRRTSASSALVGIIDPLRAEAKAAVRTALGAGIDVRMITGDHAVTAQAIGEELGLGPGAISGERAAGAVRRRARRDGSRSLHVFGRVSPAGQAPARPRDAGAGPHRRDDRRCGERRGCAQAGRHRRGDGFAAARSRSRPVA